MCCIATGRGTVPTLTPSADSTTPSGSACLRAASTASVNLRPEVPIDPCRGEPFRAENEARPPVDVVVAWSFEAVLKSGAGSCAVGRCVCFEHEDQICPSLQLLRVAAPR